MNELNTGLIIGLMMMTGVLLAEDAIAKAIFLCFQFYALYKIVKN